MPRPPLDETSATTRVYVRLSESEAAKWREHARKAGYEGNVSLMVRRIVDRDIAKTTRTGERIKP